MKKNKLTLHYIIGIAAFLVFSASLYLLYQDPKQLRYLMLTIIACALVVVAQFLIISRSRKG